MPQPALAALAAVRAQSWAILPEYLHGIEALALRVMGSEALIRLALDGHGESLTASMAAIAATGSRLEGARMSTVRDGTAVVPVLGPIFPRATLVNSSAGGTALDAIMADFRVAQAGADIERIVMFYDTPGGVVSGMGEAAEAIRSSPKPVIAFVTGMAASAGYWLASQAGELVLDSAAGVGSIGVIATTFRQEAPGTDGRRAYEVVSSNAPNKRPDVSSEEGRAALQAEVDGIEGVFIADVARGRKVSTATVRNEFGRGGMLWGKAAVEAGMADRVSTLDALLRHPSRRTGSTTPPARRALAERELETRRRAAGSA